MENANPFDLNTAIARWRSQLAQSPAFRAENLDELEEHLRDSMRALAAKGLSAEESFYLAARRLGRGEELDAEFGKFNAASVWRSRACWMIAGVMLYSVISDLGSISSSISLLIGKNFTTNGFALGWLAVGGRYGLYAVAGLFLYLALQGRWPGLSPSLRGWLRDPWRAAVLLIGSTLGLKLVGAFFLTSMIRSMGPVALAGTLGMAHNIATISSGLMPIVLAIFLVRLATTQRKAASVRRAAALLLALTATVMAAGCGKSSPPPATATTTASPTSGGTAVEQCLTLWQSPDKKSEAVESFLKADWTQRPVFSSGTILGYSESQFIALPEAARAKVSKDMMTGVEGIKAMWTQAEKSAQDSLAKGDKAAAEKAFTQLKQCGDALDQPQSLALLQILGKGFKKKADADLAGLSK